ncbi:unnamed protein product [Clavelina lepadiformis]|uniref:Uncharacterized protein n=1 Tax=Clavelina lepadiformis TaxID=159417 RepID=A0ABP0FEK5_CLALP
MILQKLLCCHSSIESRNNKFLYKYDNRCHPQSQLCSDVCSVVTFVDNGCTTSFTPTASSKVSCSASNVAGSVESKKILSQWSKQLVRDEIYFLQSSAERCIYSKTFVDFQNSCFVIHI